MVQRTKIRNVVASQLRKMLKDIPVELTRPDPLTMPDVPRVLVYYADEDLQPASGHWLIPQEYHRMLMLTIDIVISGAKDPDRTLDNYGFLVEEAFYDDHFLTDKYNKELLTGCFLKNVKPVTFAVGDRTFHCQRQTWYLQYESEAFVYRNEDEFLQFRSAILNNEDLDQVLIDNETTIRDK